MIHQLKVKYSLVFQSNCRFNTGVCSFLIVTSSRYFPLQHQGRMKRSEFFPHTDSIPMVIHLKLFLHATRKACGNIREEQGYISKQNLKEYLENALGHRD